MLAPRSSNRRTVSVQPLNAAPISTVNPVFQEEEEEEEEEEEKEKEEEHDDEEDEAKE